jgi:nucleotide-binding universal stress UspA family protein
MPTMLVPLDGSALGEQVLPYVQLLAAPLKAQVTLLHVVTDPEHEYTITTDNSIALGNERSMRWARQQLQHWLAQRREIERYLDTQAAPLRAAGIEVTLQIELGSPVATILEVANSCHANLIAMASHGYGRLRRWASGSIADQVLHSAARPVLLVREGLRRPAGLLGRILAPLDGAGAELAVLHIVAASIEEYLGAGATLVAQRSALRDHVAQAYAAHFGPHSAAQARIAAVIGLGNPADVIIEEAARRDVDLIVLANAPDTGALRQRTAGGMANQIFHAVDAPLLLVPGGR